MEYDTAYQECFSSDFSTIKKQLLWCQICFCILSWDRLWAYSIDRVGWAVLLCLDSNLRSPGYLQIHCVVSEEYSQLLIFLPLASGCWGFRCAPLKPLWVLGGKLRASHTLERHSTNWATTVPGFAHSPLRQCLVLPWLVLNFQVNLLPLSSVANSFKLALLLF